MFAKLWNAKKYTDTGVLYILCERVVTLRVYKNFMTEIFWIGVIMKSLW